jgi:hypothetical protein
VREEGAGEEERERGREEKHSKSTEYEGKRTSIQINTHAQIENKKSDTSSAPLFISHLIS